jgi:hypothetical protein
MNIFAAITGVAVPGADQVEHLTLALGQPEGVRAGRGARPGRDRPDAEPARLLPGDPRGGRCAHIGEDCVDDMDRRGMALADYHGPVRRDPVTAARDWQL